VELSKDQLAKLPVFFIIGRPRSGTTLLRTLFDAHPNVIIPLESPVFIVLYNKYHRVKHWDNDKIDMLCDDLKKIPKFGSWTIDLGHIRKYLKNSESNYSFSEICKIIYSNYQSFYPKQEIKLIGDKNPPYTEHLSKLMKLFPGARFIYMQRDYRDQIISMRKLLTENPDVSIQASRWKHAYKNFINFKKKYPKNCIEIKYEDLTSDPKKILKEICSFLGLNYFEEMLDFYKVKEKVYSLYPKEIIDLTFKSLFNPISTEHISSWKAQLKEKEVRVADIIVGKYAEIAGYERKYQSIGIITHICAIPKIIYGLTIFTLLTKLINSLPFKWNIFLRNKLAKISGKNLYRLKLYTDN